LQPVSSWKNAPEIFIQVQDGAIVLKNSGKGSGWASPEITLGLAQNTMLDLQIASIKNGVLSLQVEWLGADGTFIKAVSLIDHAKAAASLSLRLADFRPKEKRAYQFKLKFWLEGKDAEAVFSEFLIHVPRAWRVAGTRTLVSYTPHSAFTSEEGVAVDNDEASLGLRLDGETSAGLIFSERVAYQPKGMCMLEVLEVSGSVSVDALCYDTKGAFLKSVELIHEADEPGAYESGFPVVEERVPEGTVSIAWRIKPVGKKAAAKVSLFDYGVAP